MASPEGTLEVDADAFAISADRVALVGVRSLRIGEQEILTGDGHLSFEWHPQAREGLIAAESDRFVVSHVTKWSGVPPHGTPLRFVPDYERADSLGRLLTAAWDAASPPQPPPPFVVRRPEQEVKDRAVPPGATDGADYKQSLEAVWEFTPDQPAPAGSLRAGDLDGDGVAEVVVRIGAKRVVALSASGQQLWQYEHEEGIADVFLADLEGQGQADVLVVEHPRRVVRLRGDGTVAWEWAGVPNTVNLVYADDLNGDGRPEVLVGYFSGYLALNAAGELLWTKFGYGHNATLCRVRDVDGDGVPELLGGSLAATFCLFDEAQEQGVPKPAFTNVQITGLEFADADGDGQEEVLLATDQGLACYSPAADKYLWTRRSDAPLVGLALIPREDGPHLVTATRGAFAQTFSLQGELQENRLVGDAVNALCPCGEGRFALACDDGRVRLVDPDLRPTAWAAVQGRPTALFCVGDRLMVASDTGVVQAFRLPR
jgi:hypothetical protein